MSKLRIVLVSAILAALIVLTLGLEAKLVVPRPQLGSVAVGSEYHATSTRNFNGVALTNLTVLNSGNQGVLGSVVITGAAAGQMNFYDATTSDVTQRLSTMSSTTQLLATIPASAAAGTYTFDVHYQNGLLIELLGTISTSTITFR